MEDIFYLKAPIICLLRDIHRCAEAERLASATVVAAGTAGKARKSQLS